MRDLSIHSLRGSEGAEHHRQRMSYRSSRRKKGCFAAHAAGRIRARKKTRRIRRHAPSSEE